MKLVTAYAWEMKHGTPAPLPDDGYPHLHPGDHDLEKEVTRCRECTIVKEWKRYHADKASPSRHKDTCKSCLVKKRAAS